MKSGVRCVQEGNLAAVLLMMKLHFKLLLVSQGEIHTQLILTCRTPCFESQFVIHIRILLSYITPCLA